MLPAIAIVPRECRRWDFFCPVLGSTMGIKLILAISILLQITSSVLALRLIPVTGKRRAWVLISAAIFLMAIRRCITLVQVSSGSATAPLDWSAEWVAFITSVFMVVGIALIGPLFRSIASASRDVRESEERYRKLFEESGDAIYVRGKEGRFLDVNRAGLELFGFGREEMIGMDVSEIYAVGEDRTEFETLIEKEGSVRGYEMRFRRKDGTEIQALVTSTVIRDRDGTSVGYRGIIRDITLRKQMEEELKKKNEILGAILSASPMGIALVRDRVCCWANETMGRMMNCTGDALLGKDPRSLYVNADEYERVGRELYHAGNGSEYGAVDTQLVREGGTLLDCHLRSRSLDVSDPSKGQIIAVLDISERKRAESALRQNEAMFRALTETAASAIFIVQRERFQYVNPATGVITGYSPDEMLAMEFWRIVHPDFRTIVQKRAYSRLSGEEAPSRYELKIICKNGDERWIDVTAAYIEFLGEPGILGTAFDITEHKMAEEALLRSEKRYRRFFDEDLAGAYISSPDGRLLACNPAFARIFGFSSVEDALRCNLGDLYPDPEGRRAFIRLLERQGNLQQHEKELRRVDGKPVHAVENAVGTFTEEGELIEIKGYLFDNTEVKQLSEQLRQSQKMEAIGRLAGGIAHDFNNLLTAITGYAELLLASVDPLGPLRSKVEQIHKAADRAASLTQQLLAFSRKQMLRPEVLDVNLVVADMELMLNRLIGEDIELTMELERGPMRVKADRGQIEQVIMNLVVNARDAMPRGGTLSIETSDVELSRSYAHSHLVVQPGPYIMLAISDSGVGMDEETRSLIFEPFFTTKGADKGTGLGLATVYGIVKQSGGSIWVYSEPGKGTTFKIYFPRILEASETAVSERETLGDLHGSEAILLVEDDAGVRELLSETLKSYGYVVMEASNGGDAIRISIECGIPLHLMITDVVMPGIGGCELAARVADLRPEIKVLYISGYTDRGVIKNGIVQPGAEFLQKPFGPETLISKVRDVLDSPKAQGLISRN